MRPASTAQASNDLSPFLAAAQAAAAQQAAKPVLTGVAHVALRVSDVDAELSFFNKLGFEKSFAIEEKGKTAFIFVKINDTEFIEVHPHTPANSTTPQPPDAQAATSPRNGGPGFHSVIDPLSLSAEDRDFILRGNQKRLIELLAEEMIVHGIPE